MISLDDYPIILIEEGEFFLPQFTCADDHPRIQMTAHQSCKQCYGDDDYGSDFCPICSFCCGC